MNEWKIILSGCKTKEDFTERLTEYFGVKWWLAQFEYIDFEQDVLDNPCIILGYN